MKIPENIEAHNQEQFEQINALFTQAFPIQAVVIFNNYGFRDQALERIVEEIPQLSHVALDLGGTQVNSLKEVIEEKLEDMIEAGDPESHLIHVVKSRNQFF